MPALASPSAGVCPGQVLCPDSVRAKFKGAGGNLEGQEVGGPRQGASSASQKLGGLRWSLGLSGPQFPCVRERKPSWPAPQGLLGTAKRWAVTTGGAVGAAAFPQPWGGCACPPLETEDRLIFLRPTAHRARLLTLTRLRFLGV